MKALCLAVLALVMLAVGVAPEARAQSLSNFKIGDDIDAAGKLGPPVDTGTYKIYSMKKWRLVDGNEFNISHTADGKIAYIETDWGHGAAAKDTGMFGFSFGVTSLADIREKLGSNGMAFKNRAQVFETAAGLGMMNAYEVGDTVISFITILPKADFDRAQAENTGDHDAIAQYAKLEAIMMASQAYADSDWGERMYDKAYKKIDPP